MQLSNSCVLIVDDDPLVAMNHSDMLEDAGCQAIRAESVATAFNIVKSRPFDAIVLDHDLGDGKGWDLLRLMREASLSAPVVYLSAAVAATLDKAASLPEVKCVLSKPVSKEALTGALAEMLKGAEKAPERYPRLVGDEEREMLLGALAPRKAPEGGSAPL